MSVERNGIERLYSRLLNMVGRGRIKAVDDTGVVQTMQVEHGPLETRDNLARVPDFGFTSNPPPDAHAVVIYVGGNRSDGVVIGTNHQASRLKNLGPGEVAIYDAFGKSITLKENEIVIEAAGKPITINNADDVTVHTTTKLKVDGGDLEVTGNITDQSGTAQTMAAMRTVFNSHTHSGGAPPTQQM